MATVIDVNFNKFTLLQSQFAQDRAISILDRASFFMLEGRAADAVSSAMRRLGHDPHMAWISILFDAAVNEDLFITMIKDENIIFSAGEDAICIPLGEIFKAAGLIYDQIPDPDVQAEIWDQAVAALMAAAKSMRQ